MRQAAGSGPAGELLDGLFGPERRLYKRLAQYSFFEKPDLYHRLARRPYPWLVACAEQLAALLQRELGMAVRPTKSCSSAPGQAGSAVQRRNPLPQDGRLPALGRRVARGPHAGPASNSTTT